MTEINSESEFESVSHSLDVASAHRVNKLYLDNGNRFELICSGKNTRHVVFPVPGSSPSNWSQFEGIEFKLVGSYPDEKTAKEQLDPEPHFFVHLKTRKRDNQIDYKDIRVSANGLIELALGSEVKLKCFVVATPSEPFVLGEFKNKLVHLLVHPHGSYDPDGKNLKQLEPYLLDRDMASHVFFEAHGMPYYVTKYAVAISGNPHEMWDAEKDIYLKTVGEAVLHIAPRGVFHFDVDAEVPFPKRFLLTGGHLSECVAWMIAHLCDAFAKSSASKVDIILPLQLLVLGKNMEDKKSAAEIGAVLEQEVRRIGRVFELEIEEIQFETRSNQITVQQPDELRREIKGFIGSGTREGRVGKVVVFNIIGEN